MKQLISNIFTACKKADRYILVSFAINCCKSQLMEMHFLPFVIHQEEPADADVGGLASEVEVSDDPWMMLGDQESEEEQSSEAEGVQEWMQRCSICGRYARVPHPYCKFCKQRPSWHHGRCCPQKPRRNCYRAWRRQRGPWLNERSRITIIRATLIVCLAGVMVVLQNLLMGTQTSS